MKNRFWLKNALMLFLFITGVDVSLAEIYKCRDKSGAIGFYDAPCVRGTIVGSRYTLRQKARRYRVQIYKSSYNTSSDYIDLNLEKVAKSPCLKTCLSRAMSCGSVCSQSYQNMSGAQSCFLGCKSRSQGCVQTCQALY